MEIIEVLSLDANVLMAEFFQNFFHCIDSKASHIIYLLYLRSR